MESNTVVEFPPMSAMSLEAQDQFVRKLIDLCKQIFFRVSDGDFAICHEPALGVSGDDYWSVEMAPSSDGSALTGLPSEGDFIFRIPCGSPDPTALRRRVDNLALGREFAMEAAIAVPKVLAVGWDTANPLSRPYILLTALEGVPMSSAGDRLQDEDITGIAGDLGFFQQAISRFPNVDGGKPVYWQGLDVRWTMDEACVRTDNFPWGESHDPSLDVALRDRVFRSAAMILDTRLGLRASAAARRDSHSSSSPSSSSFSSSLWGPAQRLAAELASRPLLESDGYFLSLGPAGWAPANVFVGRWGGDGDRERVTGILEWDDAHFAPAAVAFAPPHWAWLGPWCLRPARERAARLGLLAVADLDDTDQVRYDRLWGSPNGWGHFYWANHGLKESEFDVSRRARAAWENTAGPEVVRPASREKDFKLYCLWLAAMGHDEYESALSFALGTPDLS